MDNKLSKYINNGDLVIKKKRPGGPGTSKLSPNSRNYQLYLQNGITDKDMESKNDMKTPNGGKKIKINRNNPKGIIPKNKANDPSIRIIRKKEKKSKHRSRTNKYINQKDINEVEREIESNKRGKVQPSMVKVHPITVKVQPSMVKVQPSMVKVQPSISKPKAKAKPTGISRKNKRSSKRESRKVSMKKHRKISEKDIRKVQKHIEEIRSKKTEDIKLELEKEGIKVSGKSKRLLKDIYLYSKVCGINIKYEK